MYKRKDYRSRNGLLPSLLIIHDTEGSNCKADLKILQAIKHDPKERSVSIHILICPDGTVYNVDDGLVDLQYSAYHTGLSNWQNVLNAIDENASVRLGFKSWDDYLRNRTKTFDISCDYIHSVSFNSVQTLDVEEVESLKYVDNSGKEHDIEYGNNIKLSNITNVRIENGYDVNLVQAQGILINEAKGVNDSAVGIELTNPGDTKFPETQLENLAVQSSVILEKYPSISAFNILSHADIAPSRKQDPSGYFDWLLFYQKVSSKITDVSRRKELESIITAMQLHSPDDNKVLLSRDSSDETSITILQNKLQLWGYTYVIPSKKYDDNTCDAVQAFNRHFCPEIFTKEKKEGTDIKINPKNQQWYQLSQVRLDKLLEVKV